MNEPQIVDNCGEKWETEQHLGVTRWNHGRYMWEERAGFVHFAGTFRRDRAVRRGLGGNMDQALTMLIRPNGARGVPMGLRLAPVTHPALETLDYFQEPVRARTQRCDAAGESRVRLFIPREGFHWG